jgi:hypothetical protein
MRVADKFFGFFRPGRRFSFSQESLQLNVTLNIT